MKFFNFSKIPVEGKYTKILAKKQGEEVKEILPDSAGKIVVDTEGWSIGSYFLQFFVEEEIVKSEVWEIEQNLAFAPADFDPRPESVKILEAIEAFLTGTASQLQKRVKIGNTEIEYSSFEELQKWRIFYAEKARRNLGRKKIRKEIVTFGGIR